MTTQTELELAGAEDLEAAAELAERRAARAAAAEIRTVDQRLAAWSWICPGAGNCLQRDGVGWSWDARPRRQKNGAAIGRCYRQARGEFTRDVGAYKIGADGRVLQLPAELRAILPGGLEAADPDAGDQVDEQLDLEGAQA